MEFMVPSELIQPVTGCVHLFFFHGYSSFFLTCYFRSDYVPCTKPLNMTITLDDRPDIPLDLTPQDNQAEFCIGLIQTADSQLSNPNNSLGDIILGVSFLQNVYTIMAYTAPNANGSFSLSINLNQTINPMLGLLSLYRSDNCRFFLYRKEAYQPISGGGDSTGGSTGESLVTRP
jgi:hypothetical protein